MSVENRKKVYDDTIAKGKVMPENLLEEFGATKEPVAKEPKPKKKKLFGRKVK